MTFRACVRRLGGKLEEVVAQLKRLCDVVDDVVLEIVDDNAPFVLLPVGQTTPEVLIIDLIGGFKTAYEISLKAKGSRRQQ